MESYTTETGAGNRQPTEERDGLSRHSGHWNADAQAGGKDCDSLSRHVGCHLCDRPWAMTTSFSSTLQIDPNFTSQLAIDPNFTSLWRAHLFPALDSLFLPPPAELLVHTPLPSMGHAGPHAVSAGSGARLHKGLLAPRGCAKPRPSPRGHSMNSHWLSLCPMERNRPHIETLWTQ